MIHHTRDGGAGTGGGEAWFLNGLEIRLQYGTVLIYYAIICSTVLYVVKYSTVYSTV